MAYQAVGLGTTANDGTGDPPRTAGIKINANFVELYGPATQFVVAASTTLALTATHNGGTIILGGTGATVSGNAATLGNSFSIKIINDTGSDWTMPLTGGTIRPDIIGHTKITFGASGGIETYTRLAVLYIHLFGSTS